MAFQGTAIVTGGTGFVGSRLVRALLRQGARVRILSSGTAPRDPALEHDPRLSWFGLDDAAIDRAADGVTHFFNFAVAYDRPSIDDRTIAAVNVELPLRVMSRLAQGGAPVRCILGDTFFRKFMPEATHQVRYTRSKAELVERLDAMTEHPMLRVALLQIEQVYGPGEAFTKAFPSVTQQMVKNMPRIAMTSGHQGRDFVYVDDVVDAALTVATADWEGLRLVECGSGVATPVRRAFEIIHEIIGSASVLGFGDIQAGQAIATSHADTAWLRRHGWTSRTTLHDGLRRLVDDVVARVRSQ